MVEKQTDKHEASIMANISLSIDTRMIECLQKCLKATAMSLTNYEIFMCQN